MKSQQFYPVIMTDDVQKTSDFYKDNFRFQASFESDWYVHLQSTEDEKVNLAIMSGDHETIPKKSQGRVSGLILNFEVDDVDAEFSKAQEGGLPIIVPIKDEAFGQRHFLTEDPNGVLIDVITPIPPSEEFLKQYAEGSTPTN